MRRVAFLLLSMLLAALPCRASFKVTEQDDSGITVSFDFSDLSDIYDGTGRWAGCRVPGFSTSLVESSGVNIPADAMLFAIPPTGEVRLSIGSAAVRGERMLGPGPPAPGLREELLNLPGVPAEITSTGFMRGQRIAALRICPAVFDGARGVFRIYDRFNVRLDFTGAGGGLPPALGSARKDPFEDVYKRLLVNHEQGKAWRRRPEMAALRADGDDYFTDSPNWIKVKIESTGIYRIEGSDLVAAGVSLAAIDPATLRLYGGGGLPLSENLLDTNPAWMTQMALKVDDGGDGSFDPDDEMVFYALGVRDWTNLFESGRSMESYYKSFFSDYNYYWLTWGGSFSSPPKQMSTRSLPGCSGCDFHQPASFLERVHVEMDALSDFNIRAEDGWYWRPLRLDDNVRLSPDTPYPDPSRKGKARVRVADWHSSKECSGRYFRLQMGFNGYTVADSIWQASLTWRDILDLSASVTLQDMDEQEITLKMSSAIPPAYPGSYCSNLYLAWYEMYYWRRFVALNNRLAFFSPDTTCFAKYESGGFTSPSVYAFDVTDQFNVAELSGFEVTGTTSFQVSFYDSAYEGALRRYALTTTGNLLKPAGLNAESISDIRHRPGNDYLIITRDVLMGSALKMSDLHDGEIVTVDEIYDEFGWGMPDVTAIRDFLRWRYDTGADLHYVLLLGDATWDYKGYHTTGGYPNYVPSYERRYMPPVGDPYCTDDFFCYLTPNTPDGSETEDSVDYYLDVALARIAAPSAGEAAVVVEKSIAYQTAPVPGRWQNRVCLVADDDRTPSGCDARAHTVDMEYISNYGYPVEFDRTKIYLVEYPFDQSGLKPGARAEFIAALNSGVLIANYVGHGDQHRMAQEEVLNPSSIPLINTGRKEFFLIAATCNVSRFDEVTLSSMTEELIKKTDGGAIGSFASTHFCIPERNKRLNTEFLANVFPEGDAHEVLPVADAVVIAKAKTSAYGSAYRNNNEMFTLLADPRLELFAPELEIEFDSPLADTLSRKGIYEFSGRVMAGDTVATWLNDVVTVYAFEGQDESGYMSCMGFLDFVVPGSEIFRGQAEVTAGEFSVSFLVSTDAREGTRGQLRGIIAGAQASAAGLLDSVEIYGELASLDDEGPEMSIVTAGGEAGPGDTLSVKTGDRLRLDLVDSSGVAIRAKSEFIPSVSVMVDEGERIDLTDSVFAHVDDFRASYVYFDVPAMQSGVHDLAVAAFDNLNNFAEEDFRLLVEGQVNVETNVVHVYPNPVSQLSYIICEYERMLDIDISVWTVAGRKIWSYRSDDARSYHEVPWRARDNAGDPVANGTYIMKVEAKDPEDPSYTLTSNVMLAVLR